MAGLVLESEKEIQKMQTVRNGMLAARNLQLYHHAGSYLAGKSPGVTCLKLLSALPQDAEMGVLTFCVGRQIQQLGQCVDVCITIHEDQALHTIRGIFRIRHQYMRR